MDIGNTVFRQYLEEAIGRENALIAFSAFNEPASVSVRVNPYKRMDGSPFVGKPVLWSESGLMLEDRPSFTFDPYFHAGAYYVQDSSSMFVGYVFRKILEERFSGGGKVLKVLDLCASPGGKTTDLAASLRQFCGDDFLLVSNEVMKQRTTVLAGNVAVWGDPNVVVTCDDPSHFAGLEGFFDIILADVPCSGEGMFRKNEEAVSLWSEQNVALCAARQRRIVADVWPALSEGGVLIYSTCTFNRYENDDNIRWIESGLGAESVLPEAPYPGILKTGKGFSLVPGHVDGEGQYCSAVARTSSSGHSGGQRPARQKSAVGKSLAGKICGMFCSEMAVEEKGGLLKAVPAVIYPLVRQLSGVLHIVSSGCAAGTFKGDVFVPDADLAMSVMFSGGGFPAADLDMKTAVSYLQGNPIVLDDMEKGYVSVRYGGLPLGFVKNLGTRCNNLYPQSRRIRKQLLIKP